jgi:RNA-directed DNA polymerase
MIELGEIKNKLRRYKNIGDGIFFLSPIEVLSLLFHKAKKVRQILVFESFIEEIVKFLTRKDYWWDTDSERLYDTWSKYLKDQVKVLVKVLAEPGSEVATDAKICVLLEKSYKFVEKKLKTEFPICSKIEYKIKYIPKKGGGKRRVYIPNDELKNFQKFLLLQLYNTHFKCPYAHGFVPGRSAYTNAVVHKDSKLFLKFDIKDAFDSVDFNVDIAPKLEQIVGFGWMIIKEYCTYKNRIPQGAPTSGWLFNLALSGFDAYIGEICDRMSLRYSRYADDIVISGDKFKTKELLNIAKDYLKKLKLKIHKVKIGKHHMKVTGYTVVSGRVTVPRKKKRLFRAMLHNHFCGKRKLSPAQINGILGYLKISDPQYADKLCKKYFLKME